MTKIGDTVRFLNSTGGGIIRRIEGNIAYVDEDGFETPTLLRECVVVAAAAAAPKPSDIKEFKGSKPSTVSNHTPSIPSVKEEEIKIEETPEGEKLNVVLAYEPENVKRLNDTSFSTYLVNDSNYYLYFTYMTRADEANGWTMRYAGMVEPNMQVFIEDIAGTDLPAMDRVAVQLIAFKDGKEFNIKSTHSSNFTASKPTLISIKTS